MTTASDSDSMTPDRSTPVPLGPSGDRIASLDFIRGVAVLGILAANIVAFGQPMTAYMYPGAFITAHGVAENWMWVAQFVLIDGKMRGLFTLLFGAGVYLFLERASARGGGKGLQARRLAWLGLFGALHFFLLWRGDILLIYAISGLFLLPFLHLSAKRQVLLALLAYALGALAYGAMTSSMAHFASAEPAAASSMSEFQEGILATQQDDLADGRLETELIAGGDYAGFVAHNFSAHAFDPLIMVLFFLFETVPLMLLGAALYRLGLFTGGMDPARLRRRGWIGVIVGTALTIPIALSALNAGLGYYDTLAAFSGFSMLPRLPVILGLAALLALWAPHATGWLGRRLSAAGRAAFTNYLGTSMLMVLVFHGWAGGLFGELTRGQLYLVVLAAWAVMLAWPVWWLARYRFGPLEWLWRCLTYGRRFPLRR
ncbi:MAG TPA: DUF418 domain-containing protein [Qipengyuania sp.]|nr:DUF418 domain-containing protein [Qipengyuania sp.]